MTHDDRTEHPRYSMLIQWDGETFIVTFPESPGHQTQGNSWTEAARNGEALLGQILESGKQPATKQNTVDRPQADCCSFCDKPRDQVQRLTEGPGGVRICNECVDVCREVIEQEGKLKDLRLELAKRNSWNEKLEEMQRELIEGFEVF